MIALVSGATDTVRRYAHTGCFGQLMVPSSGASPQCGLPWACDNGAFAGFNEPKFLAMLERLSVFDGCLWVTAPDVVGDAEATLALFNAWQPRIAAMGYPVALVGQDGLTVDATPWDRMACLFIGGSTDWKLGPDARLLIAEAKRRGLLVHVGRVNTARRVRYLEALGVDSIDGTKLSMWPDRWFPYFVSQLTHPQLGMDVA